MADRRQSVAVVIPCYRVERHIEGVIHGLPDWIQHVVAVDDASPDDTRSILDRLEKTHPRLTVVHHKSNQGVGGAMVSGFKKAIGLNADIVVKMDGDGQMDPKYLPDLLLPLIDGRAAYAKGNRLRTARDMEGMPFIRLLGNVVLTFLTKVASGYWHIFDAQNGYLAIRRDVLDKLPLDRIDRSYFFENSMLAHLNVENTPAIDIPMEAVYQGEKSNMSLWMVSWTFPLKLLSAAVRRATLKHFIYDITPVFGYAIVGFLCLAFSVSFGGVHWWRSISTGQLAPTGTVVLSLLPFLVGFQLWLQAFHFDAMSSPRPLNRLRQIDREDIADHLVSAQKTG